MGWEVEDLEQQASAQEVLQSVEEAHKESALEEQQIIETLSEAMKRIEEANLWKTILNLDVFQAGSARPEIVNSANAKLRKFARENLEVCVGMRVEQVAQKPAAQEVRLPFDSEELQALKILAAKVLKRDVTKAVLGEYKPQITQVASPSSVAQVATVQGPAQADVKVGVAQKSAVTQQKRKTSKASKQQPPPGYIPPAKGYVPPAQSGAIVSTDMPLKQTDMANLVTQLINQASGGNVLVQSPDTVSDVNDVNERF